MKKSTLTKHEQYKRIYKKYTDGLRWLKQKEEQGTVTQQDRDAFNLRVIEPMNQIKATFTEEVRKYWAMVEYTVNLFNGKIILEEEQKKQQEQKRKIRTRRWKRYSRAY